MEARRNSNNKIPLYARRKLGEKVNAALDFLRQNWQITLRFTLYVLLPVALLHSMGVYTIFRATFSNIVNSVDLSVIMSALFFMISICLIYSLILTLFQYYMGSEDGDLSMLTFSDVKGQLWHNLKRVFLLAIPILIAFVVLAIVAMIIIFMPFFSIFAMAALATLFFILMMVPIFYVLENIDASTAVKRAFSHAKNSWGNLLGLMIAMTILVAIIQGVIATPMIIFSFAYEQLTTVAQQTQSASKIMYDAILYVFVVLHVFFSYLSLMVVVTTLVFHYGSDASEHDDIAIANDIENFANL